MLLLYDKTNFFVRQSLACYFLLNKNLWFIIFFCILQSKRVVREFNKQVQNYEMFL